MSESPIKEFYKNKTIFVTGGTGFIGKVLIEKLLRSTEVSKIYVLTRPKKGETPQQRIKKLVESDLFDTLREISPNSLERVHAIQGDVEEVGLGIQDTDLDILYHEVDIVIHSAATVRFDEKLSKALRINVNGVSEILTICKQMKKLEALVHVSTAYVHCENKFIDESLKMLPTSPRKTIEALSVLGSDVTDAPVFTKSIIGARPNTYTYTKALAEHLIFEERNEIPVCFVRPSIVSSTLQEPVPGWIDNLNGPTGFFLIAGLGVLRTAVINDKLKIDGVPVDTCASIIIAAAHQTAVNHRQGHSRIKIYNHVSGPQAPLTWGDSYSMARTALLKYPFENVVWYPVSSFNNNEIENKVYGFVLQDVPARVTDMIMQMLGRKVFAVRLSSKMQTGLRAMKYFTSNEWRWENSNSQELFNSLSPADKLEFNFSLESISWDIFLTNFVQGLRKYILKQDPSTIPATRTKLRKLYFAHIAVQTLGCLVLLWLVYLVFSGIRG